MMCFDEFRDYFYEQLNELKYFSPVDEDWLEWEWRQERDPQIVAKEFVAEMREEDLGFMPKEETGNNLEED